MIDRETVRCANLDQFFRLTELSDPSFEYTVAWLDCLARGSSLGRGPLQRANHSDRTQARFARPGRPLRVPFVGPISLALPEAPFVRLPL